MMLSGCFVTVQRVGLVLLTFSVYRVSAQTQCFLPNGSDATGAVPCSSSSGATNCCPSDYQCLPFTQLCYKANPANVSELQFARGSCTDQHWGPGCPGFCASGDLNSSPLVTMDRCDASPEQYCCVEGSATSCTCDSSNMVDVYGTTSSTAVSSTSSSTSAPTVATTPAATSASTSRGTSAPTSAPSTETTTDGTSLPESSPSAGASSSPTPSAAASTNPEGNHFTLAQKIGLGIGVSIGTVVVSLGGLALMMYRMKSDPDDPEDDEALNGEHELPDPPSTTNSYQGGNWSGHKAVSPSHWVGTAAEEASRRPFSEASSQYTADVPYASSTTFADTHQSGERSVTPGQWPLSSQVDYPQLPPRAHSPTYRSSYDIFGAPHRNEI